MQLLRDIFVSLLAAVGMAIIMAIAVTIADLYLTGHSITSPDLHSELPGLQMSWGGIIMMTVSLTAGVGTFIVFRKSRKK